MAEFTLYQTEPTEMKNGSEFGELSRSEVNDKSEDMKRISHHFERFAGFSYIADITIALIPDDLVFGCTCHAYQIFCYAAYYFNC